MEIIYQGIYLPAKGCKYYQFKEGSCIKSYRKDQTVVIEFPKDTQSKAVADTLGLEHLGRSRVLSGMGRPERFKDITFEINGLKFRRLTHDPHFIRVILVSDSESRVLQKYTGTTFVISKEDYENPEFCSYVLWGGGLRYIVPVGPKSCLKDWRFRNIPGVLISESGQKINTESSLIYALSNRYDDYRIRSIDYQEQFITEIRRILSDYGVELVRTNREETLRITSYVTYNFSQTPVKETHPKMDDLDSGVLQHRVPIEFELRCTDMKMFYDFKNKYNNVDLLTNMCEYRTQDRYGDSWAAAVKWGPITEDFNHVYSQDNNSNFSYQCQFRAELFFYEVYDRMKSVILEVNYELEELKDD